MEKRALAFYGSAGVESRGDGALRCSRPVRRGGGCVVGLARARPLPVALFKVAM